MLCWLGSLQESDVHSHGLIKESVMKGSSAKVWAECGGPDKGCGPLGPLEQEGVLWQELWRWVEESHCPPEDQQGGSLGDEYPNCTLPSSAGAPYLLTPTHSSLKTVHNDQLLGHRAGRRRKVDLEGQTENLQINGLWLHYHLLSTHCVSDISACSIFLT